MSNYLNTPCQQSELFNLENVRVLKHAYDQFLLRKGWDEETTLFELRRRGFRRITRYDELVNENTYLLNKFNMYPKSIYYVNEFLNLILVVADDRHNPGDKVLVTCLYINDYMIDRYNLAA